MKVTFEMRLNVLVGCMNSTSSHGPEKMPKEEYRTKHRDGWLRVGGRKHSLKTSYAWSCHKVT